jgi:hypothetical protein
VPAADHGVAGHCRSFDRRPPLMQLPFQVLVTEKPDTAASGDDAFRRIAWLVRKHALTVLPSVSSLKALRQLAKDSHAGRAMIGFGNHAA